MSFASDRGLTLVEMLVALAILSVIGVAGMTMLDNTLRVQRGTEDRLARLTEIDRAFAVLRRDFATATPGYIELQDGHVTFIRAAVPGALTVELGLYEGGLGRWVSPPAAPRPERPQRLLEDVDAARWRILDGARAWRSDWPEGASRPRAVELSLDLRLVGRQDLQTVTRVFPVPAGATP